MKKNKVGKIIALNLALILFIACLPVNIFAYSSYTDEVLAVVCYDPVDDYDPVVEDYPAVEDYPIVEDYPVVEDYDPIEDYDPVDGYAYADDYYYDDYDPLGIAVFSYLPPPEPNPPPVSNPIDWAVTVVQAGGGWVNIWVEDGGRISGGGIAATWFVYAGYEVEVWTSPGQFEYFSHWEGDGGVTFTDANNPNTTFIMPDNAVTIRAVFIPATTHTLTVTINDPSRGSVSSGTVAREGWRVELRAYTVDGHRYRFVRWEVTAGTAIIDDVYRHITRLNMPANDATIQAVFVPWWYPAHDINITPNYNTRGTVSIYNPWNNRWSAGNLLAYRLSPDSTVTISAEANDGYYFQGWVGNVTPVANQGAYQFTMPALGVTLQGIFAPIPPSPPVITSVNNTTLYQGMGGTFQVTASGTRPMTFSLENAPGAVQIDTSTGLITVAPHWGVAMYTFTITATNELDTASQVFTLHLEMPIPPTITSPNHATVHRGGTFTATATGTTPITFALEGAPTGVTIDGPSGVISVGQTAALGLHNFSITASNIAGFTSPAAFALTVTVPAPPPPQPPPQPPTDYIPDGNNYQGESQPAPTPSPAPTPTPEPEVEPEPELPQPLPSELRTVEPGNFNPWAPGSVNGEINRQLRFLEDIDALVLPVQPNAQGQGNDDILVLPLNDLRRINNYDLGLVIPNGDFNVTLTPDFLDELHNVARRQGNTDFTFRVETVEAGDGLTAVRVTIRQGQGGNILYHQLFNAPITIGTDLGDAEFSNPYRVTAINENGERIGGRFNPATGLFEFATQSLSYFVIAYIPELRRLTLRIGTPYITDIADNAPTQRMDVLPVIQHGRILLPIRFVAEALGATVTWERATDYAPMTIFIDVNDEALSFPIGEVTPELAALGMDVPAQLMNGRTMVPLRFVSEFFGAYVSWDSEESRAEIIFDAGHGSHQMDEITNEAIITALPKEEEDEGTED
ncbi:MAG: stalk domain-containing protein [Defluviitaleaceae bacterium]|nr:stalk domain-containing protein [Defluviitaleaceae bacterium]MCL2239635.1 stalk domain-containing protein [Defluviitaleaceae bacterium]